MSTYTRRVATWLLRELDVPVPRLYTKPAGRPHALDTAGEREVLDGLECEETYNSIARRLGVSRKTVWRIKRRAAQVPRGTITGSNINLQTSEVIS